MKKPTDAHIIRKYPNRRLYDTQISTYINLEDIKQLILEHTPFQVISAKSGEDLTHTTLLQIIHEQEDHQAPIFTNRILEEIIRYYGNANQSQMSKCLEASMNKFLQQEEQS